MFRQTELNAVQIKYYQRVKKKILKLSVIVYSEKRRNIVKLFPLGYYNPIEHLFDRKGENYDFTGTWGRVHNLCGRA